MVHKKDTTFLLFVSLMNKREFDKNPNSAHMATQSCDVVDMIPNKLLFMVSAFVCCFVSRGFFLGFCLSFTDKPGLLNCIFFEDALPCSFCYWQLMVVWLFLFLPTTALFLFSFSSLLIDSCILSIFSLTLCFLTCSDSYSPFGAMLHQTQVLQ